MSYSQPAFNRDRREPTEAEQQERRRRQEEAEERRRQAQREQARKQGEFRRLIDWSLPLVPNIDKILGDDQERESALLRGDKDEANEKLAEISNDLDQLLGTVETELRRAAGDEGSVKKSRNFLPRASAMQAFYSIPVREIASILGVKSLEVEKLIAETRAGVEFNRDTLQAAINEIENLRTQLRSARARNDHSLLRQLLRICLSIILAIAMAAPIAAAAALATSDSVSEEIVKQVVTAILTLALTPPSARILKAGSELGRARKARKTQTQLLNLMRTHADSPPSSLTSAAQKTEFALAIFRAEVALLGVYWPDRSKYWKLLMYMQVGLMGETDGGYTSLTRYPIRRNLENQHLYWALRAYRTPRWFRR